MKALIDQGIRRLERVGSPKPQAESAIMTTGRSGRTG
jgi:hypothetical protein